MAIFDSVFKKNNKRSDKDFYELLRSLTNLTDEDISNLKEIESNGYYNTANNDSRNNEFMRIVDRVFNRTYNYGDNSPQSRKQLYQIYDEMDNEVSYISAALDILSDDATQADEDGTIITVVTESDKVKALTENFISDFGIEEKLSKWARVVAKYGDYFIKVSAEEGKGITKICDTIYPSNIERLDFDGELVAFSDNQETSVEGQLCPPWDYVHFKHKGDITSSNRDRLNNLVYSEDDSHDLTSSYGQSVLRPAIKVYAQLRFVENMILLSRLTNSVRRNIFMINVGDVAPDKSFETIQNYADLLKKNIDLNLEQGIYNSQKKTIPYDEDIFIPVSDPKNDVRIEQVGGDANIEEQYDLEYLLNKLFSALKIPKAYLNYEQDLNARSTLIQLDIRYARSVSSLQQTLRGGLLRLVNINLAFHGLDPDSIDLDIVLTPVSTIDADSKRQETLSKIEVANSIWKTMVDINDKLSGNGQSEDGGLDALLGESKSTDKKESIDLNYAANLVFTDYLGFSPEEVEKLFGKSTGAEDSCKSSKDNRSSTKSIKFRKVKSSNPDLMAPYPTSEGYKIYERLRESIKIKSETIDE